MYTVAYKPKFVRSYKKMPPALQDEIKQKIEMLKENPKHPFLKSHLLSGHLKGYWICWVNYSYRIIFKYEKPDRIVLLNVGDHDVYK